MVPLYRPTYSGQVQQEKRKLNLTWDHTRFAIANVQTSSLPQPLDDRPGRRIYAGTAKYNNLLEQF